MAFRQQVPQSRKSPGGGANGTYDPLRSLVRSGQRSPTDAGGPCQPSLKTAEPTRGIGAPAWFSTLAMVAPVIPARHRAGAAISRARPARALRLRSVAGPTGRQDQAR